METFSTLIVLMVPCVFACVQTCQDVCNCLCIDDTSIQFLKATSCRQASGVGSWKGGGRVAGDELGQRGRTSGLTMKSVDLSLRLSPPDTVLTVAEMKKSQPWWELGSH